MQAGRSPRLITKAVTITSPDGVEAGIVPPVNGTAITINAGPTDEVQLRGLTINGSGTAAMSPLVALIMPRLAVTLIWRPLQPRQQKAQPRE